MKTSLALVATSLIALSACVAPAPTSTEIVVRRAPPPLRAEEVPPPPSREPELYVWEPGHWHWSGTEYVWRAGHYEKRPAERAVWVHAEWVPRNGEWVYRPGHWEYH